MTALAHERGPGAEAAEAGERAVIERASERGFRLGCYETEHGQVVWEWRRGAEPRPQFVTRRIALHWMAEFLDRPAGVAFVTRTGHAYR